MHLNNNNIDYRRYNDNGGFNANVQRDSALRYAPSNAWGTPDRQILQKKDTNIDFQASAYHADQVLNKSNQNNRAISPYQKNLLQTPSSPYSSNSPFKKITGVKKTPNGKQNSFHQHQGSFVGSGNGNMVMNNSNFYNNSEENTLNTTDASFSQFLNQTANKNNYYAVDISNASQQNPMSQRQTRQAASMHSQAQMGYKSPQNTHAQKILPGGLAAVKGTPAQQKNGYENFSHSQYTNQGRNHSVYASPINNNSSQYLNDSELTGTPNPQSTRQFPTPYQRTKSTHTHRDQQGNYMYANLLNDSQNPTLTSGSHYQNSIDDSGYNQIESIENSLGDIESKDKIRIQSLMSARGHNKTHSCYAPNSLVQAQNNQNSQYYFNSNYDNFSSATAKQINQIENFFSNPKSNVQTQNSSLSHNTSSSSLTPSYRQNANGMQTPRQPSNNTGNQNQFYNNSNLNNSNYGNHNQSMNTPQNYKQQNSGYQQFEQQNKQQSQQIGFNPSINFEQSIQNVGHTKSNSLHQQRSTQSFHTSGGSINQSNFLQNSSFLNHLQKQQQLQLDSKSTFNPSSNFGSIAQNKSGFLNSQSSFLNSNGAFLIPNNSLNGFNYQNGANSIHSNNTNSALNGLLGQQSLLNKGPQLQKIIDDLKENIVKDLESLTSKLYKESESIINSSGNSINSNNYESTQNLPIQLAEYNLGDDKKVRFSFSGNEVITQITSTNMKLKRNPNENKENIISTYATPITSQFLSPYQQQILSQQIMNSAIGRHQQQQQTPKSKNNECSAALHTFSSPQSIDETPSVSHTQNIKINYIPTQSPANNIKRPTIFNNPSKLFEKGQKDQMKNASFTNNHFCEQEEEQRDDGSKNYNFNQKNLNNDENVRIINDQQSQGEEKLFEEFFKNNDSNESNILKKQPQLQNKNTNTASTMTPEIEQKQRNTYVNHNQNKQQVQNNSQQKEVYQTLNKPEFQEQSNQNQEVKQNKPLKNQEEEKNISNLNSQDQQIATPQKKESKVINTEESEKAPGKLTPCFQSSKTKNCNKNAVTIIPAEKFQNLEKPTNENTKNGLTPFSLKFENKKQQIDQQKNNLENKIKTENQEQKTSSQIPNKNSLVNSNNQENVDYEDQLSNLTKNLSIQNKNDNLSDQDDVVLRTDNTDQLSEGSPKNSLYSSTRKSKGFESKSKKQINKKDDTQQSASINKLPLAQFNKQLENINEKDCESGNSTPNAQNNSQSQNQSSYHSRKTSENFDQDTEKRKKSQFHDYVTNTNSGNKLKDETSQTINNHNTSMLSPNSPISGKKSTYENNEKSLLNNSHSLQTGIKIESSLTQDLCPYRGSSKSNQSNSSAQNRYQDSTLSSRKQSYLDNNCNDMSNLNTSNTHNNSSFASIPGSNLKSSRYQQNSLTNVQNSNQLNSSSRNKQSNDSSYGQIENGNNVSGSNFIGHSSSATNLQNGNNIRFSTYLKQHEEQKNQSNQNTNTVFDNKSSNNNNNSSNNLSYLSNYSSQPHSNQKATSPASSTTPKQFLFKNRSNLSLFKEYEIRMKTPTKQGDVDLNLSSNSNNNGNISNISNTNNKKPNTASKLFFNTEQMNRVQEENLKRLQSNNNDDEVHTSRENPLEQIRENTNNTQENEESQFLFFQNTSSNLINDTKKTVFLNNNENTITKPIISADTLIKKDPPRPIQLESETNNSSSNSMMGNFFNSIQDKKESAFFYTPLNKHENSNTTNNNSNKLNSTSFKLSERDESSASSYKQSQLTSSPYYISSRSNFYESTQKLIEDSVIIQNKKNDLSNGNISKYSSSSSNSKSKNMENNSSSYSNQDESKRSDNNRILGNAFDDDDTPVLNIDDHLDNNILNEDTNKINNDKQNISNQNPQNSTPEKIKRSSQSQQREDASTNNNTNLQTKDIYNNQSKQILTKIDTSKILQETEEKKKSYIQEDDTPSSTVNFQDNSDSLTKKRAQYTFNVPNQKSQEQVGDICRNLKLQLEQEFEYTQLNKQNMKAELNNKGFTTSNTTNSPQQQNSQTSQNSASTPQILQTNLSKETSIERDISNQQSFTQTMKNFEFSAHSSSQSLNNIPESNSIPSFQKTPNHHSLNKVISSSIQVVDEDGCEITVSIVSHKRSSINQSKTILKKSLMGSPTSSALAKANSVKKSQRRISFKDKIEEVYNFEPEDRSTSRSPISKGLPRSKPRFDLKKEPYFDSIKKFPGIQNNPALLQQYKSKGSSNISWITDDSNKQDESNNSLQNINLNTKEEDPQPSSVLQRRDSKLNNVEDTTQTKPQFKPLCFTPNSNTNKKYGKISFLEYQKINKN